MNQKQRCVAVATLVIVVLEILFPPWVYVLGTKSQAGFHFIASEAYGRSIDSALLAIEIVAIVIIGAGVALLLKDASPSGVQSVSIKKAKFGPVTPARRMRYSKIRVVGLAMLAVACFAWAASLAIETFQLHSLMSESIADARLIVALVLSLIGYWLSTLVIRERRHFRDEKEAFEAGE